MKVLILGISGMLGNAMFRFFSAQNHHEVWGTLRNSSSMRFFDARLHPQIISDIDVLNQDTLIRLLHRIKPDYVINCIGLVKQLAEVDDPLITLPINAMFPHQLARLCALCNARMLQISTDCVFSGAKGNYSETDISDATDLYGKSKWMGEVQYPHTLTIRTSIIGHELQSQHSLIDWFLSQSGPTKGYTKAIFSGFPTIVLAKIIHDYMLERPELSGVYHVAANAINKFDLLSLVAKQYQKSIELHPDERVNIDRSLDASRFNQLVGYRAPDWPQLVETMHNDYLTLRK